MTAYATKFKVGKTYSTRSMCDYDTVYRFEIVSRTAKQVTFKYLGDINRRGVKLAIDNVEFCRPFGTYSMCPVIRADEPDAP